MRLRAQSKSSAEPNWLPTCGRSLGAELEFYSTLRRLAVGDTAGWQPALRVRFMERQPIQKKVDFLDSVCVLLRLIIMKSAIAIGAHPDDIEFYMAGTLVLLKRAGWEIHYL